MYYVPVVGGEDYEELTSSNLSIQLNFNDDYRRRCFNVTVINDDVSEQIESFYVYLELGSEPFESTSSVDLMPDIATINILDDDGKHDVCEYSFLL